MITDADRNRIVAEAIAALPEIAAALDPKEQPVGGSWVAFTVHAPPTKASGQGVVLHRCFYTWRHDAPLEPLEESRYLELTRDEQTGAIKVPVWAFGLTPLGPEAWRLSCSFGAPLRFWLGKRAGGRVMGHAYTYVARRRAGGWKLEFGDIVAG